MAIPQGPQADMDMVRRVLNRNIAHALGDVTRSAGSQDFGDFERRFPLAGSKWRIAHTPMHQGGSCVGYTVKVTQDWRTGHIPAHFDIAKELMVAAGYTDIRQKLNTLQATYIFA